jgi:hypothetical protein
MMTVFATWVAHNFAIWGIRTVDMNLLSDINLLLAPMHEVNASSNCFWDTRNSSAERAGVEIPTRNGN